MHPVFECRICIDDMEIGHGTGDSKKEAEQNASLAVSRMLTDEMGDYILDSVDRIVSRSKNASL